MSVNVDLEAIKRKLQKLSRQAQRTNVVWKPTGEHTIRILPPADPQNPFKELYFYFFLPGMCIAPGPTFGKPDPIAELADKLRKEGTDAAKAQARLLYAKLRAYAPLVVRGEEEQGVRWWGFGKRIYEQMLGYYMDKKLRNFADAEAGYDIKLTFRKANLPGEFPSTTLTFLPGSEKLCEDAKKAKEWIENVPDLLQSFELKTYDELSALLNQWLNDSGGNGKSNDNGSYNNIDNAFTELLKPDEE